jgi:hypothetical protein
MGFRRAHNSSAGLVALTVLAVSQVAAGAGESASRYVDSQYGYSFEPPAGWTRKTDMPRPYVAFLGPMESGSQVNLCIYSAPAAHKSFGQYVKDAKETISKRSDMRLQSDRRDKLAGVPAQLFQSLVTARGFEPAISRQVVAVRGDVGYIVAFTAPPQAYKKYVPVFDKVIASFRWKR